jgi:hypothetical protein
MFLDNSRYAKTETVEVTDAHGRKVQALKRRKLVPTAGEDHQVLDRDQLDMLAQAKYGDPTRFWHIADANTALEANELVVTAGKSLKLPRS